MPFFKDTYILRRFGESTIINGHQIFQNEDMEVELDVQTVSDEELMEETGSRDKMILKTFGDFPIRCSKQEDNVVSDQLFYEGRWFECISSRLSKNTFIKHWTSTFSLVPESTEPIPDKTEEKE